MDDFYPQTQGGYEPSIRKMVDDHIEKIGFARYNHVTDNKFSNEFSSPQKRTHFQKHVMSSRHKMISCGNGA